MHTEEKITYGIAAPVPGVMTIRETGRCTGLPWGCGGSVTLPTPWFWISGLLNSVSMDFNNVNPPSINDFIRRPRKLIEHPHPPAQL